MESAQRLLELALTVTCVGDASVPDRDGSRTGAAVATALRRPVWRPASETGDREATLPDGGELAAIARGESRTVQRARTPMLRRRGTGSRAR